MTDETHDAAPAAVPAPEGAAPAGGLGRLLVRTIPVALGVTALAVAGVVFAGSLPAGSVPGGGAADGELTSGAPAPDFALLTPEGKTVRLSDFRGRPVMVNFWATWCPPCRAEMPDMQQLADERGDALVVLAVNVQEAPEPVRGFVQKYGLKFPILLDTSGEVSQAYRVVSLPTSFFIDPEGNLSSTSVGALNRSAMARRVDQALGLP